MNYKILSLVVVVVLLMSCSKYSGPAYNSTSSQPDTPTAPYTTLVMKVNDSVWFGNMSAGTYKTENGGYTSLKLNINFTRFGMPHTLSLEIPDYNGTGKYGKNNVYKITSVSFAKTNVRDTLWIAENADMEVNVLKDNNKYIECDFAGVFKCSRQTLQQGC